MRSAAEVDEAAAAVEREGERGGAWGGGGGGGGGAFGGGDLELVALKDLVGKDCVCGRQVDTHTHARTHTQREYGRIMVGLFVLFCFVCLV